MPAQEISVLIPVYQGAAEKLAVSYIVRTHLTPIGGEPGS